MCVSPLPLLSAAARRRLVGCRRSANGNCSWCTHPGVIVAEVFGAIAVSQFLFAAVSLSKHLIHSSRLIPQAREAIGRQLRAELEAPRGLPSELAALVIQLGHA
jgi:hypothetical protein